MKKNKSMRLAASLMVLVILTTCAISGTFAKYTSSASGNATATVAKWSFKVSGTEIAVSGSAPTVSFELFNTINDSDNTTAETDVAAGKIAPGTSGSFDLKVKNDSEVTAKYTVTFSQENTSDIPLEFSTDKTTWKDSISDLNVAETTLETDSPEKTQTIYWRWAFDGNDAKDTSLGINAPSVNVTATITATQVD